MQRMTFITVSLVVGSLIGLPVITMGKSYNKTVYQTQKRLQEVGYDPGLLDGFWGKTTESAIKAFQQDKGLPITGELDGKTKEKLGLKDAKQTRVEARKADAFTKEKAGVGPPVKLECTHPGVRLSDRVLDPNVMIIEIPNKYEQWEISEDRYTTNGEKNGQKIEMVIFRTSGQMKITYDSTYVVIGTCKKVLEKKF